MRLGGTYLSVYRTLSPKPLTYVVMTLGRNAAPFIEGTLRPDAFVNGLW